ncbi:MAG: hypothetical protein ACR2IK_15325 [Chloroflexota bacterium]
MTSREVARSAGENPWKNPRVGRFRFGGEQRQPGPPRTLSEVDQQYPSIGAVAPPPDEFCPKSSGPSA